MPAVVTLLLVFSISKAALINKNKAAIKTTAYSFKKTTTDANAKNRKTQELYAPMVTINNNLNKLKTDTVKVGNLLINTPVLTDSIIYVINGVKATKADVKAN